MDGVLKLFLILLSSYLIGSFPTAIIVSKTFFGFDIREKGSGNMGSTNAFRVLGWKWGLTVQLVDIGKGLLASLVLPYLFGSGISFPGITWFEDMTIVKVLSGIAAVAGHNWTIFAGFKGGKGINTATGMLIGIAPVDTAIALGFFLLAVVFSGYISLGSITAALALPFSMFFRYNILKAYVPSYETSIYFLLGLTAILIFQHRKNIKRLLKGTENKFSKLQLIKCKHSTSTQ
jgi:glycerol-3-phosphate acyltransferase PlsY